MSVVLRATALVSALLMAGTSQSFAQAPVKLASENSAVTPPATSREPGKQQNTSAAGTRSLECCTSKSLPAAAWDRLAQDIQSDRESRRTAAVAALAVIGRRDDILPLLEGALGDKQAAVRKDAAVALGDLQARSTASALRKLLDDPSPDVSFAAANALWKMDDHSGRNLLIATLNGDHKGDGFVKSSMKSSYQRYRDPKQLAIMGAREAAGSIFGPASLGITMAQEFMKDRGAASRATSATLLAKDPAPESVHELTLALTDKNWTVRVAAAQALAKSPGQVSPEVFEPLLIDDSTAVRDMAAAGIIRITHTPRPANLHWPAPPSSGQPTQQEARR